MLRFELEGELLQHGQKLLLLLRRGPGGGQRQVRRHRFAIWKKFMEIWDDSREGEAQKCVMLTSKESGLI